MTRFLGSFYCDACSHGMRVPIWLLEDNTRLCRDHYLARVGEPPPKPLTADDLSPTPGHTPTPDPLPPWSRIVPGLRARPGEAGMHSLQLQCVRNVKLGQTVEVGDCSWTLGEADMVELFLLASAYRYSPAHTQAMVRVQLFRLLHGKEQP